MLKLTGMSEAAEGIEAVPAGTGGNKKLLVMVLVFNVVIAGALGYLMLSGKQGQAEKAHHAAEGAHEGEAEGEGEEAEAEAKGKDGHKAASKFGPLVEIGSFVANLSNPGSGPSRYAKVTVHVEAFDEEAKVKVEAALVPIRAEALMYFSNAKVEDVIGQDKIQALSEELLKRITVLVGKKTVRRVFFSELVVQ